MSRDEYIRDEYIRDEQVVRRARAAVNLEIKKLEAMDIPVSVYDSSTGKIYSEKKDGKKVQIGIRLRKGRYSERISKEA